MFSLKHINKINRNRPTIGVTGPDKGGGAAWYFTALSVFLAGGYPIRITPANPRTSDGLQALIIGGGADVDPRIYEQQGIMDQYLKSTINHPRKNLSRRLSRFFSWIIYPVVFFVRKLLSRKITFGLDYARDHLELQLLDQAVKKDLPVIGICRGAQLMNVYFRGSLHKNIDTFYVEEPNPASVFPVKKVKLKPGSKLEEVLGTNRLKVNALHNQAVNQPGKDIEIVARELNTVVQGIEHTTLDFMIGIQWHPEYLFHNEVHNRLFKRLVEEARQVSQQIEERDLEEMNSRPQPVIEEAMQELAETNEEK